MTSSKRRTTRGPNSFFLLLIVACLVGAAFLVQDPELLDRISYVISGGRTRVTAAEASSVKPAAKTPGRVVKPARSSSSTQPNTETTQPNAAAIPAAPEAGAVAPAPETPPVKPDPSRATVKTDSAVAYSSSSENSSVVSVLKKDTPVQTTFELLNSDGRWTMIKIESSGRPAYVRSENLQRATH